MLLDLGEVLALPGLQWHPDLFAHLRDAIDVAVTHRAAPAANAANASAAGGFSSAARALASPALAVAEWST